MVKIGHQSNVCPKKKFKKKFAHVGRYPHCFEWLVDDQVLVLSSLLYLDWLCIEHLEWLLGTPNAHNPCERVDMSTQPTSNHFHYYWFDDMQPCHIAYRSLWSSLQGSLLCISTYLPCLGVLIPHPSTTTIITLQPCALNAEFHHFILRFSKISLLCRYHWNRNRG
jgi:hypothetical protein